ncbi:hypothetical protein, partial [Deinococcus radiophilus]|uniref:hypothetical protein n=1 Tax=Deinococcus radiophilus TaxID=32062 RepID=UPI001B86B519
VSDSATGVLRGSQIGQALNGVKSENSCISTAIRSTLPGATYEYKLSFLKLIDFEISINTIDNGIN